MVSGVWGGLLGGVTGVTSVGRLRLLDVAAPFWICMACGRWGGSSAALEALREEMLPLLSLLKSPPKGSPLPTGENNGRSGLPFFSLFLLDPDFRASFILNPGEMLRDLEDLPDPIESTERVDVVVIGSSVDPLTVARFVSVEIVFERGGSVVALEIDGVRGGTVERRSGVVGKVVALMDGDEDVK